MSPAFVKGGGQNLLLEFHGYLNSLIELSVKTAKIGTQQIMHNL